MTTRQIKKMIRETNNCLYAEIRGLNVNLRVADAAKNEIVTLTGRRISASEVTSWINGLNGQTL